MRAECTCQLCATDCHQCWLLALQTTESCNVVRALLITKWSLLRLAPFAVTSRLYYVFNNNATKGNQRGEFASRKKKTCSTAEENALALPAGNSHAHVQPAGAARWHGAGFGVGADTAATSVPSTGHVRRTTSPNILCACLYRVPFACLYRVPFACLFAGASILHDAGTVHCCMQRHREFIAVFIAHIF